MNNNIIVTIGPITESIKSIKNILKKTDLFRLNGSHNNLEWHSKISNKIKSHNKDSFILLDVPGIKPRTDNKDEVNINKNSSVLFSNKINLVNKRIRDKNICIPISRSLPNNINSKLFSICDGQYFFKIISKNKNYIIARSKNSFILSPKKGINFPYSIYDNKTQLSVTKSFLKKSSKVLYDAIGLSFVQSETLIKKIKILYPLKIIVSKIENQEGVNNIDNILKYSDAIMIDRGDLSAEIGIHNLFNVILQIVKKAKNLGIPIIMATENFDSMILKNQPSKSEIMSAGLNSLLGVDKIMLSDETATSHNWKNTIEWLDQFLKLSKISKDNQIQFDIKSQHKIDYKKHLWNTISNIKKIPLMIITKSGKAIYNLKSRSNDNNVFIFTDSEKTKKLCKLWNNTICIKIKKLKKIDTAKQVQSLVKENKKILFKRNSTIAAIYVANPTKGSDANTIYFFSKKITFNYI